MSNLPKPAAKMLHEPRIPTQGDQAHTTVSTGGMVGLETQHVTEPQGPDVFMFVDQPL